MARSKATAHAPQLNRDLLKEIGQLRALDAEGRKWSEQNYVGGYTSYASAANLHETSPNFGELRQHIDRHVRKFVRFLEMDVDPRSIYMNSCWVNIMPPGAHHSLHLHPLSFISGTYYVATPAKSAPLKFEDPRLSGFMNSPPKCENAKARNRHFVSYAPQAQSLILFESWLRHEVPSQQGKSPRISVSFNYSW